MLKQYVATLGLSLACLTPLSVMAAEELNFQSIYGPTQTQNIEILQPWAESFGKNPSLDMQVHFFPLNTLTEINEVIHAVKDGSLDIGVWGATFPKAAPHLYSYVLPFLIDNSSQGTALFYEMYKTMPEVKNDVDSKGVLLAAWCSAPYGFASVNTPIRTPNDLKGKRVLIISAADSEVIKTWGGVPVFVSPSDVYVGLQRGMGEVFYNAVPYQKGLRVMEVVKHITPISAKFSMMFMSINRDLYESLNPEQQKALHDSTGETFGRKMSQSLEKDVTETLELFKDSKVQVVSLTPEEENLFIESAKSLVDGYWVEKLQEIGIPNSKAWIDRIYQLSSTVKGTEAQ